MGKGVLLNCNSFLAKISIHEVTHILNDNKKQVFLYFKCSLFAMCPRCCKTTVLRNQKVGDQNLTGREVPLLIFPFPSTF